MRARRDNPAPTPTELLSSLQKLENFQADCVKRRTVADTARHVLHGPVKAALAQRHRTVERSLAPPPNRARHIRLCYIRTKRFDPIPGIRQLQAFGCGHQRDIRRDTPVPGSRTCFAVVNAAPVLGAALLPTSWRRSHPIRREAIQPRDGTCSGDMPACPRARCRRRRCALLSHLAPLSADERFPAVQAAGGREGRSNIERMAGRSIIAGGRPRSDGRDAAAHLGSPPLKSPSCARVRSFRLRTV